MSVFTWGNVKLKKNNVLSEKLTQIWSFYFSKASQKILINSLDSDGYTTWEGDL